MYLNNQEIRNFQNVVRKNMSFYPNGAYHHTVWGLAPKDSYCATQKPQLTVNIWVYNLIIIIIIDIIII